jgi:hypothetical protein
MDVRTPPSRWLSSMTVEVSSRSVKLQFRSIPRGVLDSRYYAATVKVDGLFMQSCSLVKSTRLGF